MIPAFLELLITPALRLPTLSSPTSRPLFSRASTPLPPPPLFPLYFLNRWLLNHSTLSQTVSDIVGHWALLGIVLTRRRISSPRKRNAWLLTVFDTFPSGDLGSSISGVIEISAKMRLVIIWTQSFILLPCVTNPCSTNPNLRIQSMFYKSNPIQLLQYTFCRDRHNKMIITETDRLSYFGSFAVYVLIAWCIVYLLPGGATPLYGLYRYLRPQRVWFFSRFGINRISILADFSHFGHK